jgi:DNA-binding LacI/PurR family transcriptional regulator
LSKTSGDDLSLEVFIFDTNDRQYTEKLSQLKKAGFSAAVGYNDFSALEFYRLARNGKYDIPADFSVVGFDGIMAAEYAQPPLTTVRVNRSQLVREAFQLLGNITSGKGDGQEKVLENELVLRRSVGPAG